MRQRLFLIIVAAPLLLQICCEKASAQNIEEDATEIHEAENNRDDVSIWEKIGRTLHDSLKDLFGKKPRNNNESG